MLTFKNLQDQTLKFLDLAGDTGTGLDLVKFAIQTAHDKRLSTDRWVFMLWPTPIPLTFIAGQRNYVLHPEILMLTDFWNTTNDSIMKETPSRSRFKLGVQEDRFHFEFVNYAPVKRQPVLGVVTISGSAKLRYLNSTDEVVEEDVPSGVTTQSVKELINVTKLNDSTLTLTDVSSNNLLTLTSSEYGRNYPQIRLFDDGRAEKGEYRFYRKPSILGHNNSIPDIPYPFSRVLVFDALLEIATYNDAAAPRYWVDQRNEWDLQMRQAYQEGEMEGSESRQVQEVDTFNG